MRREREDQINVSTNYKRNTTKSIPLPPHFAEHFVVVALDQLYCHVFNPTAYAFKKVHEISTIADVAQSMLNPTKAVDTCPVNTVEK